MAIDLINRIESKANLLNAVKNTIVQDAQSLDEFSSEEKAALELGYRSALNWMSSRNNAKDPAAWASDFGAALDRVAIRVDMRSSDELRHLVTNHPDPVMREQALYEYADRNEEDSIELLKQAVKYDNNRQVRWDALWALEKLGGEESIQALQNFQHDADPEIAEWAKLFISELQTGDPTFDNRSYRYMPGRTFDETIFLLIHCDLYVRLDPSNRLWGKLSLAPQALARVYGQALACPNVETRERLLLLAKTISGIHTDGSPHIDNYLFRGFTERARSDRGNFFFECLVKRPFYLSGRADDPSEGVQETQIGFRRRGCWYLDNRIKIRGSDAIRYVRGSFEGWGYINLEKVMGRPLEDVLTPGNAILSTLHDPVAGPMTNVFISGTFKGKLNDWNEDGNIDLNSLNAYSTAEGELDTDMDGKPDFPGVSCCTGVPSFPV